MDIGEIKKITDHMESIDDEQVYVIDHSMKKELNKLKELPKKNKNSAVFATLSDHADFVKSHPDFGIAFRPVKCGNGITWIPCMICKFQGEWRRVVLQYVNCLNCNWKGNAANPTGSDLYLLMDKEFEILEKMSKLPFCVCPKCGGKLSTRAIWIEGIESEEDLKK